MDVRNSIVASSPIEVVKATIVPEPIQLFPCPQKEGTWQEAAEAFQARLKKRSKLRY